jgi:hypothetical protein
VLLQPGGIQFKIPKNSMKFFLNVLLPLTLFSCSGQNDSSESNSSVVYTKKSNLMWIDDTLRVVHDTVFVVNDEGQVEYFYSYDNYEDLK